MELDCRECDEGLVEFLYGELGDREVAAFEQHLESCPKCAAVAEQLLETRSLLGQLQEEEPPPLSADDPIMAAAMAKAGEMARPEREAPPESAPSFWQQIFATIRGAAMRPAVGTAFMVMLVAGISLFFLTDRHESQETAPPIAELTQVPPSETVIVPDRPEPVAPPPAPAPVDNVEPDNAVTQQPPRPQPTKARTPTKAREPQRPPASKRPRSEPASRSAGRQLPDQTVATDRTSQPASPLVVQAVPSSPPASASSTPAATASGTGTASNFDTAPVIPTPPLPRAPGSADRSQYRGGNQQQPTTSEGQAATGASSTQSPTRVASPGQGSYDSGMAAFRNGQYRDAADELDTFVRSPSAPRHLMPSGLHHLAMSQQRTGNTAASARSYDQLLSRYPTYQRRPEVLLEAARVHSRRGNYARAQQLLTQLSTIPGWSPRAQSELARLRVRRASQGGTLGPDDASQAAEEMADDIDEPASAPTESGF